MLRLLHPNVAGRDCVHCLKYQYNEQTGQIEQQRGKRLLRRGLTPCRTTEGCPKGTPENPKSLSDRNWQAYQHYLKCRGVGRFPDDPIVERNAGIIRATEDAVARAKADQLSNLIQALAMRRST